MSRTTENAIQAVKDSEFYFKENHEIEVRNAVIIWPNFSGTPNKFGNAARTFNLVINEEVANNLKEDGWRVREKPETDEDGKVTATLYFINVKVNMESAYPPIVSLFTTFRGKHSKTALDISTIGRLDRVDIKSADCVINAYQSKMYPGKVTGYLKKLNVIQEEDIEFGGKYDDWESNEEGPELDPETPFDVD